MGDVYRADSYTVIAQYLHAALCSAACSCKYSFVDLSFAFTSQVLELTPNLFLL